MSVEGCWVVVVVRCRWGDTWETGSWCLSCILGRTQTTLVAVGVYRHSMIDALPLHPPSAAFKGCYANLTGPPFIQGERAAGRTRRCLGNQQTWRVVIIHEGMFIMILVTWLELQTSQVVFYLKQTHLQNIQSVYHSQTSKYGVEE